MQSNQYSTNSNNTSNNRGQPSFGMKQPVPGPSNQQQHLGSAPTGLASSSSGGPLASKPRPLESRPGLFGNSSTGLASSSSGNRSGVAPNNQNSQAAQGQISKPQPQAAQGNTPQAGAPTAGTTPAAGSNQRQLFGTSASNPVLVGPQPTTGTRAKRPVAGSVDDLFLINPHKEFDINAPNFADFLTTKDNPSRASRFLKEYIKNSAFMRFSHMIFPLLQRENIEWRQMKLLAESVGVDEKFITYPNRNYMLRDFIVIVYEGIIGNRKVIDLSRNLTAWNKLFQFHKFEDVDAADDPGSKFFLKDGKIVISTGFLLDRRPYPPRGERQPNNFELSRLYKDTCICGKQTTTTSHSITVSCKVPGCKMKFHRTCVGWIDDRSGAWFECPRCALTSNDPLHEVEDTLMDPSLLVKKTDYSFALTEDQVQRIKDSKTLAVEVRCMKLKYAHYFEHTWPETMKCYLNEHLIVDERPSCERHRKDQKYSTRRNLLPGRNTLRVTFYDIDEFSRAQGKYIIGVFLVNKLDRLKLSEHIIKNNEVSDEREKIFVTALVQEYGELGAEKFTCDLNCKLTLKPIKVPVRGQYCTHVQCFSLDSYLMIQVGAKHRCWSCQICGKPAHRLLYDKFFSRITFAAMDEKAKTGKVFTKFTVDRDLNYKLLTDEDAVGVLQEPTQKIPDPPVDNEKETEGMAEPGSEDTSPPPERTPTQNKVPPKPARTIAAPSEKPTSMVAEDDEDVLIDEEKSAPAKIPVTSSDEEGRDARAKPTKKAVFHSEDDEDDDDLPVTAPISSSVAGSGQNQVQVQPNPPVLDANGYLMYSQVPYYPLPHGLETAPEDRYGQIGHRAIDMEEGGLTDSYHLGLGTNSGAVMNGEEVQAQSGLSMHAVDAARFDGALSGYGSQPQQAYPYYPEYGYDVYYPADYYDLDPHAGLMRAHRLRQADEGERMFGEDERGAASTSGMRDLESGSSAGLRASAREGRRDRRVDARRAEAHETSRETLRPSGRDGRYRSRRAYQRDEELDEFVARDEDSRRDRRHAAVDTVDEDGDVVEIEEDENQERKTNRGREFLDTFATEIPEPEYDYDDTEGLRPFGRSGSRVSFKNRVYDRYDTDRQRQVNEMNPLYQAEIFRRDFRRDISKRQPRPNHEQERYKFSNTDLDDIKKLLEEDSPTQTPSKQNPEASKTNLQNSSGNQVLGKRSYMNIEAELLDDDVSDDVAIATKGQKKDFPRMDSKNAKIDLETRTPVDFMQEFKPQTQSVALDIEALEEDFGASASKNPQIMMDSFDSADLDGSNVKNQDNPESRLDQASVSVELGRDSQENRINHYDSYVDKDLQKSTLFDRETGSTQVSTLRNELPSEEVQTIGINKLSPIFKTTLATRYNHDDLKLESIGALFQEPAHSPRASQRTAEKVAKPQKLSDLVHEIPSGRTVAQIPESNSDVQSINMNFRQSHPPSATAVPTRSVTKNSHTMSMTWPNSPGALGKTVGSADKAPIQVSNNVTLPPSNPVQPEAIVVTGEKFGTVTSELQFQRNAPQQTLGKTQQQNHLSPQPSKNVPTQQPQWASTGKLAQAAAQPADLVNPQPSTPAQTAPVATQYTPANTTGGHNSNSTNNISGNNSNSTNNISSNTSVRSEEQIRQYAARQAEYNQNMRTKLALLRRELAGPPV